MLMGPCWSGPTHMMMYCIAADKDVIIMIAQQDA